MSSLQILITVGLVVLGTITTRAISFLLFPNPEKTPDFVKYLGKVLPYAVMGLLVVFSYKGLSIENFRGTAFQLIATIIVVGLQIYKRNMLLSIGVGTVVYMVLVQKFV